jgi:DNA polymerase III subunit gamma/tau
MSYIALARKWRPKKFSEMFGQEHVRVALTNALNADRVHHAFLFTGTRGCGKTTIARILAKCLNCEKGVSAEPCGVCASCLEIDSGRFPDLLEVDAASRTKVDDTRELLDNVQYAPTRGRYKVYLIDEVHMLSTHSFNALLKTLEEPPPRVKFLLATTDPQKLPVTVLSRCLQFNLKRLSVGLLTELITKILQAEGIEHDAAAVRLIAVAGDGSARDSLSLVDQLIAFSGGKVIESEARAMLGTIARDHVVRLTELLATENAEELVRCARSLEEFAPDYAQILDELAGLLSRVALKQVVPGYEGDDLYAPELLEGLSRQIAPEDVQLYYQTAIIGRRDLHLAPEPRIGFEMTLLRMLAFRPANVEATQPAPGSSGSGAGNAVTSRGGGAAAARQAALGGADRSKAERPSAPGNDRFAAATGVQRSGDSAGPVLRPQDSAGARVTSIGVASGPRNDSDDKPSPARQSASSNDSYVSELNTHPSTAASGASPAASEWASILSQLELTGAARQLAAHCAWVGRQGSVVRLALDPRTKIVRTQAQQDKIAQALTKHFGETVRVEIDLTETQIETPAQAEQRSSVEALDTARREFDQDPGVRAFKERFGATVLPDTVRPAK